MKQILLPVLLTASNDVLAQERIDTLYYNRSGSVVPSPAFAEYYRIALYPADSAGSKMFRDFYISGELRTEGHFQTIDTLDDRRTVFDGKIVSYFKNGRISEKSYYSGGLLEGEYLQYDENGMLKTRASYARGELSGTYETYGEDGSYLKMEYQTGKPIHDYYLLADGEGHSFKVRIADDMTIWESPDITERLVDYRDGVPWEVYFKNGLTIALTDAIVRDYGKWHRVNVVISNNSLTPIEFNPETDIIAYSVDKHDVATDLQVWSYNSYLKKVNRSQTWSVVLKGVSEGLASAGAGYSTSTTTGYGSYGGYNNYGGHFSYTATTTTYNAADAYLARLASQQRFADFCQALQESRQVIEQDYLKKTTIYPGESISGFVHIAWTKGERVVFVILIEGIEYIYEWGFDRKNVFLLNNTVLKSVKVG